MYNKDIYLKMFADNSWELYNQDSLELCSASYKQYLKTFSKIFVQIKSEANVLIVGGGDYQIASYVSHLLYPGSKLTVVDPYIKDYEHFVKYFTEDYLQIQLQDKINAGNLIIENMNLKFSKAFPVLEKNLYDIIIVDCSEEIVKETEEIYCEAFIKSCSKLIHPEGSLYFYIPSNVTGLTSILEKYFTFEDQCTKFIEAWDEFAYIVKLKKR